jgi:Type IV secretion system pilin
MNFSFAIPDASAATTLADVSNTYSAGNMITTGVAIVVLVASICAVLFIVWWGVMLILSGGKDEKVKPAINSIRYSVIGLIVIVIALFVAPKVIEFMGLENMRQYLGPNVIFTAMKDIANTIFSGGGGASTTIIDGGGTIGTDFTNL